MHVLNVENNRDHCTHHGLHLNCEGNEYMANKIARKNDDILNIIKTKPIQMQWKENLTKDSPSLTDVFVKKVEDEMKQSDQKVFLSTDGKQQLEVDTVNKEQQSNLQEQNKEQQHNVSEEMIQTDLGYTNKNKEAAMYEEGNKLEDCIPTDQKEDKDERILCVNTETQERKSLSKIDSSTGCTKTQIRSIEHHQENAKTNLSERNKPKLRNGDFLWTKH
jgi:hypothetical protein